MKIFITGGAGFVGKNLVDSFLKKNDIITVYDNFSNESLEHMSNFLKKTVTLVEGDITDYQSVEKALTDIDIVIHLAAKISVEESFINPRKTFEVNVNGTENILKACVKNNIQNIIVASSAAVYGKSTTFPLSESSPTTPISPYGVSKVEMENHLTDYSKKYSLNCIALRFFNIYGKGQTDEYAGVITKFLTNIAENKPLTIFGDGFNTREFIEVEDVINSIHCSIKNIQEKRGNCYNIAIGKSVTINELAELMLSISGKKLEIKYEKPRDGDIIHSQASIDLAKTELNFLPKISLKEGLKKLL